MKLETLLFHIPMFIFGFTAIFSIPLYAMYQEVGMIGLASGILGYSVIVLALIIQFKYGDKEIKFKRSSRKEVKA